jgi:hypothetical protein
MSDLKTVQDVFTRQLPKLQEIARFYFRKLPPDLQEECIQNSIALAWKYFLNLDRKGRSEEPSILLCCLRYSILQTKDGRMVGKTRHKDVFDIRQKGEARFVELDLGNFVGRNTPVDEQAAFRIDIPQFFGTLNTRQRQMATELGAGETTGTVARNLGVTPGAVSQFRNRFKQLYDAFFSE